MRVLRTGMAQRVAADEANAKLLGRITELYFDGDLDASVANTGQVSSRIVDVLPVADIVRGTWTGIEDVLTAARVTVE